MIPIYKTQVVINTSFGGFRIDEEMALWLVENRNWVLVPEANYDYKNKDSFPLNHLVECRYLIYHPDSDSIQFRSQPDLIDCVRAIKKVHENDTYPDSYYGIIRSLSVKEVAVYAVIEDYHDGKETIKCNTNCDFVDDDD